MYTIISIIGTLIRQFHLPNPYINYFTNENIAIAFNLLAGGVILHYLSRWTTGIYYETRTCPFMGSLSYFLWYVFYTMYFIFIGIHIKSLTLAITVLAVSIIFIFAIVFMVTNKIRDKIQF